MKEKKSAVERIKERLRAPPHADDDPDASGSFSRDSCSDVRRDLTRHQTCDNTWNHSANQDFFFFEKTTMQEVERTRGVFSAFKHRRASIFF